MLSSILVFKNTGTNLAHAKVHCYSLPLIEGHNRLDYLRLSTPDSARCQGLSGG